MAASDPDPGSGSGNPDPGSGAGSIPVASDSAYEFGSGSPWDSGSSPRTTFLALPRSRGITRARTFLPSPAAPLNDTPTAP